MAKKKPSVDVWSFNFAESAQLAKEIASQLSPRIKTIRADRLPLEEAWWRFFNMWNVTKDGYHSYQGRAQLYIPQIRKDVEAQARQLTKSAFPSEDCFDVSPGLTGTRRGALSWKSYHSWAMDQCSIRSKYFVAMRQEVLYGTSPIYLPWRHETRTQFRSKREGKKIVRGKHQIELFNGPDFFVRDIFRWYTFNPKKADLSDGCFEIMPASRFELERLCRKGDLAKAVFDEIMDEGGDAYQNEEFARDVLRAEAEGLLIQSNMAYAGEATIRKDDEDGENPYNDRSFMRTKIFADMIFPDACEDGEDPDVPIPMEIEIYGNSVCGKIKRNQFWHQTAPYVVGRYIQPNPDEFYGQGIPWATQFMQYEMNTKAEQGMDSATLSINPIALIDPGLAGSTNDFTIEPGATWFVNPQGVKFAQMPDGTPIANQAIQQLKALMENYSDRSPALPPQLTGKSRTATQSEMVFDSLGIDNWLFQLQNEINILTPMLEQWEAITDQNLDDDTMVMILGRRSGDMKRTLLCREDLLGRYAYKWKGASSSANKQIIARQMLDALKVYSTLPPQAQQSLQFNFQFFFKILWTELWSLPDGDKILGIPEEMVTQDAEAENMMVKKGLEIEVLPMDDDEGHMQVHDQLIQTAGGMVKQLLMAHNILHKKQKEQKDLLKQQIQMQQQQQMMLAQAAAGQGGKKGNGSGNRTQLSPSASTGDMASGVRA